MTNKRTKKEYPQFSLKWVRMSYLRPPRNGYYFMKRNYGMHIIYYDAKCDIVIMFSDDYTYAEYFRADILEDKMWARMPRLPISKILYNGGIEIV